MYHSNENFRESQFIKTVKIHAKQNHELFTLAWTGASNKGDTDLDLALLVPEKKNNLIFFLLVLLNVTLLFWALTNKK